MAFTAPVTRATDFLVTAAVWNTEHVDNMNTAWPHLIARKTADQSVTSTTLTALTTLTATVAANEVWWLQWNLIYSATNAEDMALRFTFPTAGRIDFNNPGLWWNEASIDQIGQHSTGTSPSNAVNYVGGGASVHYALVFHGLYTGGANAGSVAIEYAGASAGSPSAVIYANSTLWGVKLA